MMREMRESSPELTRGEVTDSRYDEMKGCW